jgi:tartrate/fumarate subfamily iron-sulfur-dependent hydro-lyase beta chain
MAEHRFTTPLSNDDVAQLNIGDIVFLSGTIFTARDEAHIELIKHGGIPELDMTGLGLYHCGPVMKQEGNGWRVISAGPTTSFRMETLEPEFLDKFKVKLIIGKGGMGPLTLGALKKHKVAYVAFTGGAGALAAKGLGDVKSVYYLEELGMPEAVWVFEARDFGPLIVSMDSKGRSLYDELNSKVEENLKRVLQAREL